MKYLILKSGLFFLILNSGWGSTGQFIIRELADTFQLQSNLQLREEKEAIPYISRATLHATNAQFVSFQEMEGRLEAGKVYWAKINLSNQLTEGKGRSDWILKFPLVFTDIDIYVLDPQEGPVFYAKTGFFVPYEKRSFHPIHKANLAEVHLPFGQTREIYFRMACSRKGAIPVVDLILQDTNVFYQDLRKKSQGNAMFIGFVLMIMLYNIFLYYLAKDQGYINYSLYLAGILIYVAYNTGDLADWIAPFVFKNYPKYIYLIKPTVYLTLMAYLEFIRYFLSLDKLLPKWNRFFKYFVRLGIPLFFVDILLMFLSNFNPDVSDVVTISYVIVFIIGTFAFIPYLYQTKSKKGYFIIAGVSAMTLGIIFTLVSRFQSIDFSTSFFRIGSVVEITIFSLGLAYRQREMEKAEQKAALELEKARFLQQKEHFETLRLKELDEAKNKLYTNITHEFRTPLTVILGMLEEIDGHEKEKSLIKRNGHRLLQLINQILDLAKVKSGNIKPQYRHQDIISYLQYITESFQSLTMDKKISLSFETRLDTLAMDFDEEKIIQILSNLISNALKFTPKGGKILIKTDLEKGTGNEEMLRIDVEDNGIGLSPENQKKIFDRFFQVKIGDSDFPPGTGIGLSLTKELVQLFEGTLDIQSTLDVGSTFIVRLPVRHHFLQVEEKAGLANPSPKESPPNLVESDEDKKVILVVEDNKDVSTYLKIILEKEFSLLTAGDGSEGLTLAKNHVPDLILCDVMMPKMDGFELCHQLKSNLATSHIPVIVLTAKTGKNARITGLEKGADAYLTKPFDREELITRIRQLLDLRAQLQKYYQSDFKKEPSLKSEPFTINGAENAFLQKINHILEENLELSTFSVPDLGNAMLLSQVQLYRKLKALTGKTPSLYIRSFRLEKAKDYLETTDWNIAEVAYKVGFNDPNYFSRCFNEEFQKTPTSYRQEPDSK